MAEGVEGLHSSLLLVFMAFGTIHLLSYGQCFGMRSGKSGDGFYLGAGSDHAYKPGYCKE